MIGVTCSARDHKAREADALHTRNSTAFSTNHALSKVSYWEAVPRVPKVTAHIYKSYTVPLNPPSEPSPKLTHAQLQAGLHRKVRFPQEFVPPIASCDVLSDENNVVKRYVTFKPGGHKTETTEIVRTWGDVWVCLLNLFLVLFPPSSLQTPFNVFRFPVD
ncbi:unnamed protein product [Periconia digitata]|uniref:Uncharacterized protein n=1 Tax=Periconia digitata TaxID=1303443 RepID=A0A9W4XNP0_9PLEO|nr:unnamed protein product [Periconia digitata]